MSCIKEISQRYKLPYIIPHPLKKNPCLVIEETGEFKNYEFLITIIILFMLYFK